MAYGLAALVARNGARYAPIAGWLAAAYRPCRPIAANKEMEVVAVALKPRRGERKHRLHGFAAAGHAAKCVNDAVVVGLWLVRDSGHGCSMARRMKIIGAAPAVHVKAASRRKRMTSACLAACAPARGHKMRAASIVRRRGEARARSRASTIVPRELHSNLWRLVVASAVAWNRRCGSASSSRNVKANRNYRQWRDHCDRAASAQ